MSPLYATWMLLLLAALCSLADARRLARLRRKHICPPASRVSVILRADAKKDSLEGPCTVTRERRDTCRRRMSCCENVRGDLLCIKVRDFLTRFRAQPIPPPEFPEMGVPPMNNLMQNDAETSQCPDPLPAVVSKEGVAQPCKGYDQFTTECKSNLDCHGNRICCRDPCHFGTPALMLCFGRKPLGEFPPKPFPSTGNFPPTNNFPAPDPPTNLPSAKEHSTFDSLLREVFSTKAAPVTNQPAKTTVKSSIETTTPSLPPPPPPNQANTMLNDVDSPHKSCPKPLPKLCNEDGSLCSVSCASFDSNHTECMNNGECAKGRICCADPCPNSKVKLCFPDGTTTQGKEKGAEPVALPLSPAKSVQAPDAAPVLQKEKGCPKPSKTKVMDFVECKNCPVKANCCLLDLQGTMGCI